MISMLKGVWFFNVFGGFPADFPGKFREQKPKDQYFLLLSPRGTLVLVLLLKPHKRTAADR
jgi:hypothetical protein